MATLGELHGYRGEVLLKDPDSIRGGPFKLSDLEQCEVYLMDRSRSVTVSDVWNSKLFIGPVGESCFIQDCHDCTISVACRQFTAKNVVSCTVFLYCASRPVLENCSKLRLASYNFAYPHQDQHFESAGFNANIDQWNNPNCLNEHDGWSLLPPELYYEERKELLGFTPSVNPMKLEEQQATWVLNEAKAPAQTPSAYMTNGNVTVPYQGLPGYSPNEKTNIGGFSEVSLESSVEKSDSIQEHLIYNLQTFPYKPNHGYVISKPVPAKVASVLGRLSSEAQKANSAFVTQFITAHCLLLGSLLLILLAVVLKAIEDWFDGAWGTCLSIIVVSCVVCEGIVFYQYIKVKKHAYESLRQITHSLDMPGYELECTLTIATLRVKRGFS